MLAIYSYCAQIGSLPVKNPCLADKNSMRARVKVLLKQIEEFKPDARDAILRALLNTGEYNLWDKYKQLK